MSVPTSVFKHSLRNVLSFDVSVCLALLLVFDGFVRWQKGGLGWWLEVRIPFCHCLLVPGDRIRPGCLITAL